MKISALIIGIDGWEKYTFPLIDSIQQYEPDCQIIVIDNASADPYPSLPCVHRTERLCYSKAINTAARLAGDSDWYIMLSNDVLCTGPFAAMLANVPTGMIAGPCLKEVQNYAYLEGWCVCAPSAIWNELGGWDENFQGSSWEDVSFSTDARLHGFSLVHNVTFPFVHLDQRQRFHVIPNYWNTEDANIKYFCSKYKLS